MYVLHAFQKKATLGISTQSAGHADEQNAGMCSLTAEIASIIARRILRLPPAARFLVYVASLPSAARGSRLFEGDDALDEGVGNGLGATRFASGVDVGQLDGNQERVVTVNVHLET